MPRLSFAGVVDHTKNRLLPPGARALELALLVKVVPESTISAPAVSVPLRLIPPDDTIVMSLPTDEVPKVVAVLSVMLTLLLPLFDKVIAPEKSLELFVKVIAAAPELKADEPETVRAPVWVMASSEVVTVRFCPIVDAARLVATLLVRFALLLPLFESVTAPVSAFELLVKVIAAPPTVKLVVPPTEIAPL